MAAASMERMNLRILIPEVAQVRMTTAECHCRVNSPDTSLSRDQATHVAHNNIRRLDFGPRLATVKSVNVL